MTTGQAEFEAICEHFAGQYEDVTRGRMMSSPGLRYRGRVFAFFHRDKMVFRLGEGFDILYRESAFSWPFFGMPGHIVVRDECLEPAIDARWPPAVQ